MFKAFARIFILIVIALCILTVSVKYVSAVNKKAGYYMYRCSDYKYPGGKANAQKDLESGNPEYSKLDGDKDGEACDSLK